MDQKIIAILYKRIPKHLVMNLNINEIISYVLSQPLKLTLLSRALIGLFRVYTMKCKYLAAEMQTLLSTRNEVEKVKKTRSELPLRPFKIKNEKEKIDEIKEKEVVEKTGENINDETKKESVHEDLNESMNFDGFSIEDARDFTEIADAPNFESVCEKRRKVEDDEIEIKENENSLNKFIFENFLKKRKVRGGLQILPIFDEFFKRKIDERINESIEIPRAESFSQHFDISYDGYEMQSVDSRRDLLCDMEGEFEFVETVKNFCKSERADAFYELLVLASKGKVIVEQNEPYGEIRCRVL